METDDVKLSIIFALFEASYKYLENYSTKERSMLDETLRDLDSGCQHLRA